ncbi:MAG: hypothetical protein ACOZNI_16540 [Myxococcota bacterium]
MIAWLAAYVEAAEYRRLELADGRVLVAEVVATDARGLSLRVPQGRLQVPFDQVLRIDPVEAPLYQYQTPVRVLVLPFGAIDAPGEDAQKAAEALRRRFADVPSVRVVDVDAFAAQLPTGKKAALVACGLDASCVVAQAAGADVDLVVMGTLAGAELAVASVFLDAPRAQRRVGGPVGGDVLAGAPWTLLAVEPEPAAPAPTVVAAPVAPAAPRRPETPVSPALSYVPVPGLPAFVTGDTGRGLACVAVTVPLTALIVGAAGAAATDPGELALVGAAAWWASSVVTNRAFVGVAPIEGGATVTAGGTF